MKRLLLILTLVLSSKLCVADQKSMMYGQAAANVGASATTLIAGIGYQATCTAAALTFVANLACWQAGLAYTTSALTAGMAVLSITEAKKMDASDGKSFLPSTINTQDLTTPDGDPVKTPADLRMAAEARQTLANQNLADLKAKGYDMEKFLANPEAFGVSKEQLSKMQAEVAQIASEGKSLDPEKTMDRTTEEASSVSEYSRDIASGETSVSDTELPNFDMLFSSFMPKGVDENSAPGYYGNVSLKVLNPESKLSLFERVSLKLKKLM